jgi:hypothetical protein
VPVKRLLIAPVAVTVIVLALAACSKERIVESTEYIKDVEYVQLPGDTVLQIQYIHDTIRVADTVRLIDTVAGSGGGPNAFLAIAALHYYCDAQVLDFAEQEFGLTDGWIFYLSTFQLQATVQSSSVYDLYGYIDFWAPDWSGYYPLEFNWRLTFQGGDAAALDNWVMTEPPAAAGRTPGLRQVPQASRKLPTPR